MTPEHSLDSVSAPGSAPEAVSTDGPPSSPEASPLLPAPPASDPSPTEARRPEARYSPEQTLVRLRRLGTLFRALLIAQITAGLLLLVVGLLEGFMPGVLTQLFRGHLESLPVFGSLAGLLLALDLGSAVTETKMGQTLGVERTLLRRVITVLSFVPGLLLLRRLVILVLSIVWLVLLFVMLVLWVIALLVLAVPMWIWAGLTRGTGRLVDLVDLALSELYSLATRGMAALAISPVHRLGHEEDVVLQLLHRRGGSRKEASGCEEANATGLPEPPQTASPPLP